MELVAVVLKFTSSVISAPLTKTETHSKEDEWKEREVKTKT